MIGNVDLCSIDTVTNHTPTLRITTAPEKFSEIFLGEFDTPEAIWSSEMRQLMIQKIAAHIADFTPRLLSNTRATYQVGGYTKIFISI